MHGGLGEGRGAPLYLFRTQPSSLTPSGKDSKGSDQADLGVSRHCRALPAACSPLSPYSDNRYTAYIVHTALPCLLLQFRSKTFHNAVFFFCLKPINYIAIHCMHINQYINLNHSTVFRTGRYVAAMN